MIFSGTARYNVAMDADRSNREVERALRIAQLWNYVSGINTDLVQHGWNLSGSQRQRLGIARTVCHGSDLYLFNDTFSALDYRTDRDFRDAMDAKTSRVTRIVVARRIRTIFDADRIIILDRGMVVGKDHHADLMEICLLYREIPDLQLEAS